MSLKKFNELFGLKEDLKKEQDRFVQRINQTFFKTIQQQYGVYEDIFYDICYQAGLNPDDIIARVNQHNYGMVKIPGLRILTKDDFQETLKIIVLLNDSLSEEGIKKLNQAVELALAATTSDLGIRWKDGMFYPSGAKELDEKLIGENLEWLKKYPEVKKYFSISLNHFKKSISDPDSRKDAITNSYSSIEALTQKILGNKKTFENNSDALLVKLGLQNEYKKIISNYKQIAHNYSSRHAGKDFSHIEAEAFIYMTGLLMRLIIQSE